jgi:hypothetical protein
LPSRYVLCAMTIFLDLCHFRIIENSESLQTLSFMGYFSTPIFVH